MVESTENNPKKINIWLPLLLSLTMVGGMFIGLKMQKAPLVQTDLSGQMPVINIAEPGKVEELIRYVEARYVDEVDREALIEKAIKKVLDELDPHSNYISASQLQDVNEQLEGNFEGIGIEFLMLDDTIMVVTPISGGPSEQAGILAGDKIIEIEDTIVAGVDLEVRDVINRLRGKQGTEVRVGIARSDEKELREFTITRDEIPINSVDVAYMLDRKTGYIKINRFSATTYKEFMEDLEDLVENEKMEDLVIDVRQNPGGYLQEATNILSQFFKDRNKLLVYTEGRSVNRNDYESTGRPFFDIGNIAVLIDEGSASASEILAGAIQDWDRGVIVGRRSFGKGLVQEQYNLKDGSALRLTVARYYTPSGRSIQKDYNDIEAYDNDVAERFESGELYSLDSIDVTDSTRYYTQKDGRVVYGGGGITPDIFVPLDTLQLNDYFLRLRPHVPQFVFRYLEKQTGIPEYDDISDFDRQFEVSDELLTAFLKYGAEKGVKKNAAALAKSKDLIELMIKARVARKYFGEKGHYYVWNNEDPVVKEAMKLLKFPNPLSAYKSNVAPK
ncbi:MAG: S41 family peptidase [Bacteroidota bacterium]